MIYNNALRPSTLFAILLLLLAVTGTAMWAGLLVDQDMESFDIAGLIFLALDLAFWTLSFLFFARVRWVRIATSILLHGLIVALLLALPAALSDEESVDVKVAMVALIFLGIGSCVLGILVLHGRSLKVDLLGPAAQADTPERVARRKRRRRRIMLAAAIVATLGLTYAAWRIVPLLVAEPTIAVDCLAEANRLNKPPGYDPNRDAAPHYEKLFAEYVPLPEELEDLWEAWPGDLSPQQLEALEAWAPENERPLEYLRQAAQCPYWCYELESDDGAMTEMRRPGQSEAPECVWALVLLARYKALRGHEDAGLQILTDLHMLGVHWARGITLAEQLTGIAIGDVSGRTMLEILYCGDIEPGTCSRLLDTLAARTSLQRRLRFLPGERLCAYDCIQCWFTDDGMGNGRLIPRELYAAKRNAGPDDAISFLDAVWISLNHPNRQDTVRVYDRYIALVEALAQKTPWRIFVEDSTYEERLEEAVRGCYMFRDSPFWMSQTIRSVWRDATALRALTTVLAILAYEDQEGHLPKSLAVLVSQGLIRELPADPYSDGSLVYERKDDHFTLYSVGDDHVDNDGTAGDWDEYGSDRVFWPPNDDS